MAPLIPPEYHSATEYRFHKEQADTIVRVTTYRNKGNCRVVMWFSPSEHVAIRPSVEAPFQRTSYAGLGSLDQLPLEFLQDVLLHLDMDSLFKFRQVNLRSRQTVQSLRQYEMVVSHGLNLLCTLLRTRLATDISLFDFFRALCTKYCTLCGDFGGFMSLLTWTRCCFKCLRHAPETQMRSLAGVRRKLRLTKAELDQLKSFQTLPGIYSGHRSVIKSRYTIVSAHQAILVSGQEPQALTQALMVDRAQNENYNFMGLCALPYYDRQTNKVEQGMSCAGCQLALETDIFPHERWAYEARGKSYTQDDFLEHFRWCPQAQLLWISSGEGKR